ncbi:MAG: VCBS repeat-containing protein [Phycisphaerales bacterium]|nr:VCBS repeat-containing protein [Phycisphaerales bacterium]
MMMRIRPYMLAAALLTAGIYGCQSSGTGGGSGSGGSGSGSGSSTADASGFFVEGTNDLDNAVPPPTSEEQASIGEETQSHFRAIQIDPALESSAGPKFVMPFDIDNDGLIDLITAWNQSQPVQIHLQRRDAEGGIFFVTATLGGTGPIGSIADVDMGDFNGDGWLDAVVLVKETGSVGVCPTPGGEDYFEVIQDAGMGEIELLISPGNLDDITDGDAWTEVRLERSQLPGRRDTDVSEGRTFPEFNGYTGMAVADFDGINGPDIAVAYNPAQCEFYGDDPDPVNRVVLYANPGGNNTLNSGGIPFTVTADAGQSIIAGQGDSVTLDGTGSYAGRGIAGVGPAYSTDGLNYTWTQIAGPAVALSSANAVEPQFTAPAADATLTFQLTVTDNGESDTDRVNVVVGSPANQPPFVQTDTNLVAVADAENPGAITVDLVASASDPDGGALSYSWTQVAGPNVTLTGANSSSASFSVPTTGGELRFRVVVSDGTLSESALAIVTASTWAPIALERDLPTISDIKPSQVDLDDDVDLVFTYPDALTRNISWLRNPVNNVGATGVLDASNWESRPVGHVDTHANVIEIGDIDGDGFDDVLMRSAPGQAVQWFRHPGAADGEPIFPPPDVVPERFNFPWQVYSMAEYEIGRPAGLAIGDLTGDGLNNVAVAAGGVVYWYDGALVNSRYEQWGELFVVDDTKANGTTDDPNDPDFVDDGTVIYGLTIVDLDGDGANDVIATFDRRVVSGLFNDTLLWFRNTILDEAGD